MNTITHLCHEYLAMLTGFTVSHLRQVAMAFTATLLIIFGSNINGWIKGIFQSWHFIFRVLIFILVCSVGYALLNIFLARTLHSLLLKLDRQYLVPVIAGIFILLGIIAERKSQI